MSFLKSGQNLAGLNIENGYFTLVSSNNRVVFEVIIVEKNSVESELEAKAANLFVYEGYQVFAAILTNPNKIYTVIDNQ